MPWLVHDDQVVASLDVAQSRPERRKGLLGRDGIEGALLISGTRWVHTFGMRFAIDVAYLDTDMRVIDVVEMAPRRLGCPRPSARYVLEAEAGSFHVWHIEPGKIYTVRD